MCGGVVRKRARQSIGHDGERQERISAAKRAALSVAPDGLCGKIPDTFSPQTTVPGGKGCRPRWIARHTPAIRRQTSDDHAQIKPPLRRHVFPQKLPCDKRHRPPLLLVLLILFLIPFPTAGRSGAGARAGNSRRDFLDALLGRLKFYCRREKRMGSTRAPAC